MTQCISIAFEKMLKDWEQALINNDTNSFAKKYDIEDEIKNIQMDYPIINPNKAKIIIIGDLAVSKEVVYGLAKNILGMDNFKQKIEFVSYEEATNYNFRNVTNEKYTDIFYGPAPHCTREKNNYSSFLQKVKANRDIYPNLIEMKPNQDSSKLKITKNALENAFKNSYYRSAFAMEYVA